jgi:hypothetical protein
MTAARTGPTILSPPLPATDPATRTACGKGPKGRREGTGWRRREEAPPGQNRRKGEVA